MRRIDIMRGRIAVSLVVGLAAVLIGPIAAPAHADEPPPPPPPPPGSTPPPPNLLANGEIDSAVTPGTVTPWTCQDTVVAAGPGAFGTPYALAGTPTATSRAGCFQVVPVRANSFYSLSASVIGSGPVVLGSDFGSSTSTGPHADWTRLESNFTTGPTTTRVRIFVHGIAGQAPYRIDQIGLIGPSGDRVIPVRPRDLTPRETTSNSVRLHWTGSPGATGYRIYQNGVFLRPAASFPASWNSTTITGLTPGTRYRYSVSATNDAGESGRSRPIDVTTAAAAPPAAP
jgi:hypothetical protein